MDKTPKCTVIVPTYNRVGLLRHTLDALTHQTLPRDEFEVIVVDDGSSDGTDEMVAGYIERLNLRYFVQPDEGYRVAKARNVGITQARGDVCVFLDSGVLAHSGCVAAHLAVHESSSRPMAVNGYVFCFNMDNAEAELINKTIDFDHPDITIDALEHSGEWLDLREKFYLRYTDDYRDLPAPWVMYWTCNASARTAQLRSVGMFDEAFQTWGGEDVDLGYRLHQDGAQFIVDRKASSIHCPHEKVFEVSMELVAANYEYIADKYATPVARLLTETPDVTIFDFNQVVEERGLIPNDGHDAPLTGAHQAA